MSKHYKKIIDLIKNEEEEFEYKMNQGKSFEDIEKLFTSGEDISEKEYSDIFTGKHPYISPWRVNDSLGKLLALSQHNNPKANSKVLSQIQELSGAKDEDGEEPDFDGTYKHLATRGSLSGEDINDFISGKYISPMDRNYSHIIRNPNLKPQHLEEYAARSPKDIGYVMDHPSYQSNTLTNLFNKEGFKDNLSSNDIDNIVRKTMNGYNMNGDPKLDEEQKLDLNPNVVRSLVEHSGEKASPSSLNILLDHVDPTFKKQWTDEKMGITHGSHGHTFPDDYEDGHADEDFQSENWSNWSNVGNTNHSDKISNYLAGSRHIDDDQAEHVKRHGDIDQKYKLYENKHADPRHGAEMFKKWYDDDHHHDYDSDSLNEYHKQNHNDKYTLDDLDPSTLEEIEQEGYDNGEIDESADQAYSITDYFDDEEDSIVRDIISGGHFDDDEGLVDEKLREEWADDEDWMGENPNSVQNEGNPEFDALNKLWEDDQDGHFSIEDLKAKGFEKWSDLGLEGDSDDEVHSDEIKEKLDAFGGPLQVNYADHDELHISEHPEYESRHESVYEDTVREHFRENPWDYSDKMYLYESHRETDGYQEALSEARKEYLEENAKDYMDELYDGSHQDPRFIPHHLHTAIPNFNELNQENKVRRLDGPNKGFLDKHIKDRSYEHAYGDGQHHHEMVQDYANANGGSIDIGTMNKLFPNQKDTWKKIFDGKGKITSDEISGKIEALPKTNYDISFGKWDKNKMQNLNNRDQVIMRLDHSNESIKPLMEDSSVYDTFKKVQDTSQRSGHPTKENTIAWARVDTTDPDHWMIDETQSDFGKTVQRYLKQEGADEKAGHIDVINDNHKNWRETLVNAVLKEAKKHGASKVSTHSPESKHSHAAYGSDKIHSTYKKGYKQVPRSMGFRAAEHTELPITDGAKQHFVKTNPHVQRHIDQHENAYDHHISMWKAHESLNTDSPNERSQMNMKGHLDTAMQHAERIKGYNPSFDIPDKNKTQPEQEHWDSARSNITENSFNEHEHDSLLKETPYDAKTKMNQGHTYELTPKFLKKNMDEFLELYEKLEKGELTNAAKGAVMALGLGMGAHYMGADANQKAAQQFSGGNQPAHSRSVASIDHQTNEVEQAKEDARADAKNIIDRNDKKWFVSKHNEGLSPHVYKQTIKSNPALHDKYSYTNKLSNSAFKEVIQKNPHLQEDVHGAHYDKLHKEFGGDHEKMSHAWKNGISNTHAKFATGRDPASVADKIGEKPNQDSVGEPEPNFTHRRARGSR